MAEKTVPGPSAKKQETAAPSTSTHQEKEIDDVDNEAKKLLGVGSKHMVMRDFHQAVSVLQEACKLLAKKYGETADQCADAFFSYGVALLELARMENGVLGNALEGMPEEEDDEKEEEDPNIPSASNLDKGESDSGESEDEENEGTEEKEDEEEVSNLQLAWEMLDLSKVIYMRQQDKDSKLKVAQTCEKLGEVCIESENYSQAVEDFLVCLNIQKENLEEHDRLLAETHYQLALAYYYSNEHDSAICHFTQSTEVIEKKVALLSEQLKKAANESTEEIQKEIDELNGLLPDIKEKIEDSKEAQKMGEVAEKELKETLVGGSSGFSQKNGSTSSSFPAPADKSEDSTVPVTNCVSDISHLVRKKRKPEEESPVKEAKKSKSEPVENGSGNGDAVVPTNEEVEKAEAENQTPMETVESTA